MIQGEIPAIKEPDPHYTKRFYTAMQVFANASFSICESGRIKKFEEHLKVALRLFKEGNETVKNGIINVYLYTVSRALDRQEMLAEYASRIFPVELMREYNRMHLSSGI